MFLFGRIRESTIVSSNDEDESVGNEKPELGGVEDSRRRYIEGIKDRNINKNGEKKGKE